MSISWKFVTLFCLFLNGVMAQESEDCFCSPGAYTFELDYDLTCPPVNITRNGGVLNTFCQISGVNPNTEVEDLRPVSLNHITILERHRSNERF